MSGCGVSSLFHLNLFDMSLFEKSVENPSYVSIFVGLMQSSVRSSLLHKLFSHNHDNFKFVKPVGRYLDYICTCGLFSVVI